ncbi:hypothetical protein AV530_001716 [Patagioenas fasciata monilis]|uniref:Uncharacterized protein n=1 Tax=Patagioenas fasciata monilis TaxID=372326 RepID=A0A1V4KNY9_PATFA|nr:hypothetical protein AV530_001716 [Patagioenas fasciata monilis]
MAFSKSWLSITGSSEGLRREDNFKYESKGLLRTDRTARDVQWASASSSRPSLRFCGLPFGKNGKPGDTERLPSAVTWAAARGRDTKPVPRV